MLTLEQRINKALAPHVISKGLERVLPNKEAFDILFSASEGGIMYPFFLMGGLYWTTKSSFDNLIKEDYKEYNYSTAHHQEGLIIKEAIYDIAVEIQQSITKLNAFELEQFRLINIKNYMRNVGQGYRVTIEALSTAEYLCLV